MRRPEGKTRRRRGGGRSRNRANRQTTRPHHHLHAPIFPSLFNCLALREHSIARAREEADFHRALAMKAREQGANHRAWILQCAGRAERALAPTKIANLLAEYA